MVGRFVLAVMLAVMAVGCGPVAGAECRPVGGGVCESSNVLLACETNSRFVAFPCPGPSGCLDGANGAFCDVRGSKEGDYCPSSFGSVGFCESNTKMLMCEAGRFVAKACSSCTQSGLSASCQP